MRQSEVRERQNDNQERLYQQPQFQKEEAKQPISSQVASPQMGLSNTYGGFYQYQPQSSDNYKSMSNMGAYFKKPHNPITNPLPVNVQNPYIAKEINRVVQNRPYFANMASNNLIG